MLQPKFLEQFPNARFQFKTGPPAQRGTFKGVWFNEQRTEWALERLEDWLEAKHASCKPATKKERPTPVASKNHQLPAQRQAPQFRNSRGGGMTEAAATRAAAGDVPAPRRKPLLSFEERVLDLVARLPASGLTWRAVEELAVAQPRSPGVDWQALPTAADPLAVLDDPRNASRQKGANLQQKLSSM